jgi:hypothetical protein
VNAFLVESAGQQPTRLILRNGSILHWRRNQISSPLSKGPIPPVLRSLRSSLAFVPGVGVVNPCRFDSWPASSATIHGCHVPLISNRFPLFFEVTTHHEERPAFPFTLPFMLSPNWLFSQLPLRLSLPKCRHPRLILNRPFCQPGLDSSQASGAGQRASIGWMEQTLEHIRMCFARR